MVYILTKGVDRRLKERFIRGGGLLLPTVAVLFIIIAALSFTTRQSNGQSPYIAPKKPAVLSTNSTGGGNNKPHSGKPAGQSASPAPATKPAMSFGSLDTAPTSVTPSLPSTSGVTGGLGGGDIVPSGGSSGSDGGSTGGGGSGDTTSPTVACTNLGTLAQVCSACTPPLTLQPGQKALLSSDGTCVAVN